MAAIGAEVICGRVPDLTTKQREMCKASPDAMVAVGDGVRLATSECRYQFRDHRWNCTGISNPASFGHVVTVGKYRLFLLLVRIRKGVGASILILGLQGVPDLLSLWKINNLDFFIHQYPQTGSC